MLKVREIGWVTGLLAQFGGSDCTGDGERHCFNLLDSILLLSLFPTPKPDEEHHETLK